MQNTITLRKFRMYIHMPQSICYVKKLETPLKKYNETCTKYRKPS